MKELDYGKGYKYAHDYSEGIVDQECLPDKISNRTFYRPSNRGFEKIIKERIDYVNKVKKDRS